MTFRALRTSSKWQRVIVLEIIRNSSIYFHRQSWSCTGITVISSQEIVYIQAITKSDITQLLPQRISFPKKINMAPPTATTTMSEEQSTFSLSSATKPGDFFEEVHFLGDKDGKVKIRSPPTFSNKLDERRYKMQHLAVAFRVFAKQGFDEGVAGHISLRDPVNPGMISQSPAL
jgi:hypothetical protein